MRMTGLFSGREAMLTEATALATSADNVANLNTTGYKSSRVEFGDLFADSQSGLFSSEFAPGNGVQVSSITLQADKQGSIENTERPLDLAVTGNGFFVVSDGVTEFYTRSGAFGVDIDGNLVTSAGDKVLGFADAAATSATPINLKSKSSAAAASTLGEIGGNFDTVSPIVTAPAGVTDFSLINKSADFVSPLRIYDSLGQAHEISIFLFHTANLEYTVQAYADALETGGVAGTASLIGSSTVTFENTGLQATGSTAALALSGNWSNGAAATSASIDLSKVTGFSGDSNFSNISIDGNPQGNPSQFQVKSDGTVVAITDAGSEINLGRVALAKFINSNGLSKLGNNRFIATDRSGEADVKRASLEGRGQVLGGSLENSTVDPTSEFVEVIRHQRAYQAASKIIQTYSELLGATVQLV